MMRQLDWSNSWCDRDFDPYHDVPRDEPPELEDADWAMAMYDPNLGWLDA